MKYEILPLKADMIPQAGTLLAKRHQRHRRQFPSLPRRFEEVEIATKTLSKLLKKKVKLVNLVFTK